VKVSLGLQTLFCLLSILCGIMMLELAIGLDHLGSMSAIFGDLRDGQKIQTQNCKGWP
jgi:hypothetical protein